MRGPPALVGPEDNWDFSDARANLAGFDNEFQRKFHSRTTQIQFVVQLAAETSQTAITVTYTGSKEKINQPAESGIPKVFVQRRHRSWFDPAAKPISHYEIRALAQRSDKIRHLAKIITVVGIAHNDILAARNSNARF